VSRDELVEGNSKLAATASVSEFAGFSISGWLVQAFSGPIAVLVDSVSFVFSALFVRSIQKPEPAPPPPETRTGVWAEAKDGLRVVAHDPRLRALAIAEPFNAAGTGMFFATYMIFVTRGLGFEPGVLGVIFGLGGISSLIGATMAGRAARRFGTGPTIIVGIAMMGVSMYFIPLAQGPTAVAAGLLIAQQLFGDGMYMIYDINATSLRQSIAPEEALGRVNAFMRILGLGSVLVGIILGGEIAERVGLRAALTIGASGMIICATLLFFSPIRTVRAAPSAEDEPLLAELEVYPPIA
jgi:predicted MFS family arabinose efflux permease